MLDYLIDELDRLLYSTETGFALQRYRQHWPFDEKPETMAFAPDPCEFVAVGRN